MKGNDGQVLKRPLLKNYDDRQARSYSSFTNLMVSSLSHMAQYLECPEQVWSAKTSKSATEFEAGKILKIHPLILTDCVLRLDMEERHESSTCLLALLTWYCVCHLQSAEAVFKGIIMTVVRQVKVGIIIQIWASLWSLIMPFACKSVQDFNFAASSCLAEKPGRPGKSSLNAAWGFMDWTNIECLPCTYSITITLIATDRKTTLQRQQKKLQVYYLYVNVLCRLIMNEKLSWYPSFHEIIISAC